MSSAVQRLAAAAAQTADPPSERCTVFGLGTVVRTRPPSDPALHHVLGEVRPAWSAVELRCQQNKLATIQICSLDDLYKRLRSHWAAGVNQQLRDAGQRALKTDTLEAIIRYSAPMNAAGVKRRHGLERT